MDVATHNDQAAPEKRPPHMDPTGAPADPPATSSSAQPASTGPSAAAEDERVAFISLAAHELRSPLTSVKGYAQLLLRSARKDSGFSASQMRALQAIEQQASRMSDMVAELMEAARIQRNGFELHPRPSELVGLVRHAVEQRQLALEQHSLVLEAPDVELPGRLDGPHVEQVVRDLLDNAIRYSPEGGAVTVRVTQVGDMGRVCVTDQGIGIPEAEREHIFDAFYRGPTARGRNLAGLGLGLYVSKAIIERLDGRIWLAPDDPARPGSQFCFEVPLAPRA